MAKRDFYEILGVLAPRGFFSNSPVNDSNFDVGGVRKAFTKASDIYALFETDDAKKNISRLKLATPDAPHDFPEPERQAAYQWLETILAK